MKPDTELLAALFEHPTASHGIACDLGLKQLCFVIGMATVESTEQEQIASRRDRKA